MKHAGIVALSVLVILMIAGNASADLWDIPVAPGETFRWVFVTSRVTDLGDWRNYRDDIDYYNDFVDPTGAIASTAITGVESKATIGDIAWTAIASVPDVDARVNIGSTDSSIFTVLGDQVANSTADLFDGSILVPINVTETGSSYSGEVWTGSNADGTGQENRQLGSSLAYPITGHSTAVDSDWLNYYIACPYLEQLPVYAISEELTAAVPVPGAMLLGSIGLGIAGYRLRRKGQ